MKHRGYDNLMAEALREIERICHPKPIKWQHIGYKKCKPTWANHWKSEMKVFMSESNLRKCNIDDICSDPLLKPIQHRRSSGPRPNRRPLLSDSMWYELLCWFFKSLLEMMSGARS